MQLCTLPRQVYMYVATYIRNSQVQLLLMAMHVENTVKKLELVVLVFLEIYKVRGPCHCTHVHT